MRGQWASGTCRKCGFSGTKSELMKHVTTAHRKITGVEEVAYQPPVFDMMTIESRGVTIRGAEIDGKFWVITHDNKVKRFATIQQAIDDELACSVTVSNATIKLQEEVSA